MRFVSLLVAAVSCEFANVNGQCIYFADLFSYLLIANYTLLCALWPGWHVECSAVATGAFGKIVDFHYGGKDLAFPHHYNESACCHAFSGSCESDSIWNWSRHWLHSGHLVMEQEVSGRRRRPANIEFRTVALIIANLAFVVDLFVVLLTDCLSFGVPENEQVIGKRCNDTKLFASRVVKHFALALHTHALQNGYVLLSLSRPHLQLSSYMHVAHYASLSA